MDDLGAEMFSGHCAIWRKYSSEKRKRKFTMMTANF